MSIAWLDKVFKAPMAPTDKLVMLCVADNANDETAEAWPSVRTIARKSGLAERTIQRALKRFVARGWLTLERATSGKPGEPNRYRVAQLPTGDTQSTGDSDATTGDFHATTSPSTGDFQSKTGDTVSPEPIGNRNRERENRKEPNPPYAPPAGGHNMEVEQVGGWKVRKGIHTETGIPLR